MNFKTIAVSAALLSTLAFTAPAFAATPMRSSMPTGQTSSQTQQQSANLTAQEQQVLTLVNNARTQAGLAPLTADPAMTKVARLKSQDMVTNDYFSHQSPTYGSPFDLLATFHIRYTTAGENIAGNPSVQGAFQAWMQSPGHRANILNPNYTKTGIGIASGSSYGMIFTEEFAG